MKPNQNPLDLTAVIKTPESIEFEYRLAGPFRRLPALIVDIIVRFLMIAAVYIGVLLIMGVFSINLQTSGFLDFGLLFILVIDFLLLWFYGAAFEMAWNGQTPGKWLCKLRVISTDGRPINTYQALIRNLLRPADFAPMISLEFLSEDFPPVYLFPTFLCALICMVATKRFQRLGDLAAGTMVVVNDRSWIPTKVKLEDPRVPSLASYIPPNFRPSPTLAKAVALYAERRGQLHPTRRQELAVHLAKPLLQIFNFRSDTCPDLLLCAIYYREFVSNDIFAETRTANDGLQRLSSSAHEPIGTPSTQPT